MMLPLAPAAMTWRRGLAFASYSCSSTLIRAAACGILCEANEGTGGQEAHGLLMHIGEALACDLWEGESEERE